MSKSMSGSFMGGSVEGDGSGEGGDGEAAAGGRARAATGGSTLPDVDEDDEDRLDARNAASRLATSTF